MKKAVNDSALYKVIKTINGKLTTTDGAVAELQDDFSAHASDADIHVTATDKARWDAVHLGFDSSGHFCIITKEE